MDRAQTLVTRRRFLELTALASGGAVVAACAQPSTGGTSAPGAGSPGPATPASSVTSPNPTPDSEATVLVKNVLEFELRGPFEWNGGSVTMRLHEGRLDGEPIYFVRTGASDEAFARGAMGFQPGIFREKAGNPAWSPLWDHFTAVWKDESTAVLLRNQAGLVERVAAGEIELFKGTPDTGGQGFVVNCPSPVVAPNDFEVTS